MLTSAKILTLAIIFVVTGGSLFSDIFRRHRLLLFMALCVSILSTFYLGKSIYSDIVIDVQNQIRQQAETHAGSQEINKPDIIRPQNNPIKPNSQYEIVAIKPEGLEEKELSPSEDNYVIHNGEKIPDFFARTPEIHLTDEATIHLFDEGRLAYIHYYWPSITVDSHFTFDHLSGVLLQSNEDAGAVHVSCNEFHKLEAVEEIILVRYGDFYQESYFSPIVNEVSDRRSVVHINTEVLRREPSKATVNALLGFSVENVRIDSFGIPELSFESPVVTSVSDPSFPAERNDSIAGLNNRLISDAEVFSQCVRRLKPGTPVELKFYHYRKDGNGIDEIKFETNIKN
ncbi:MAG: hypothetical protein ABJ251_04885 [Paracoccaceae bacterium]